MSRSGRTRGQVSRTRTSAAMRYVVTIEAWTFTGRRARDLPPAGPVAALAGYVHDWVAGPLGQALATSSSRRAKAM